MADQDAESRSELRDRIVKLRRCREERKTASGRRPRRTLCKSDRAEILRKTGSRCHFCGGEIRGVWDADHVLAHSAGGRHSVDNYLPAHRTCNNYRWDYLAEEFELIVKLGIWIRTEIEYGTRIGRTIESAFSKHESRATARRRRRSNAA